MESGLPLTSFSAEVGKGCAHHQAALDQFRRLLFFRLLLHFGDKWVPEKSLVSCFIS